MEGCVVRLHGSNDIVKTALEMGTINYLAAVTKILLLEQLATSHQEDRIVEKSSAG
jgi:hypothetical protein